MIVMLPFALSIPSALGTTPSPSTEYRNPLAGLGGYVNGYANIKRLPSFNIDTISMRNARPSQLDQRPCLASVAVQKGWAVLALRQVAAAGFPKRGLLGCKSEVR
ncbi:hypothetical protein QBC36DRAFT_322045 [Triangularia setosa]|uniref:Uncharacterized protein n=1 Tax=Triangularia setosa TaxID=2587417 RepID=A0AAN6WCW1_9PEZI|nr:hypothetical protein QBC36DRAFT_322045 [Podospora setosa]